MTTIPDDLGDFWDPSSHGPAAVERLRQRALADDAAAIPEVDITPAAQQDLELMEQRADEGFQRALAAEHIHKGMYDDSDLAMLGLPRIEVEQYLRRRRIEMLSINYPADELRLAVALAEAEGSQHADNDMPEHESDQHADRVRSALAPFIGRKVV